MNPFNSEKTHIEAGVKVLVEGKAYTARHGSIIGREGTVAADYFSKFNTVSRAHVKFSKQGGRWFITVPASVANSTMLDGVEAKRDTPLPIVGEHILKLSEACVVRVVV